MLLKLQAEGGHEAAEDEDDNTAVRSIKHDVLL